MLGKVTQVSVERTIGTVFGGLLGLGTVLIGHGFGQDEDIAITGEAIMHSKSLIALSQCSIFASSHCW